MATSNTQQPKEKKMKPVLALPVLALPVTLEEFYSIAVR